MKRILKFGMLSISLLFLSGCDNANRSMVFFTGTTLGIEIAFEPNSAAPAKFIIGYKRAEGLMDPVMEDAGTNDDGSKKFTIRPKPHSVFAKIAGEIRSGTGVTSPGLQGAQWFESGDAAEILARHPAMAAVLTNNVEIATEVRKIVELSRDLQGAFQEDAWFLIDDLYELLKAKADAGDVDAASLVARLDSMTAFFDIPASLPFYSGPIRISGDDVISEGTNAVSLMQNNGYERFQAYRKALDDSITILEKVKEGIITKRRGVDGSGNAIATNILSAEKGDYLSNLTMIRAIRSDFLSRMGRSPAVDAAVTSLLNPKN